MVLLYNIAIALYRFTISVASLFNAKAKKWVEGRKDIFDKISAVNTSSLSTSGHKLVWFHCASLGEFEQGRPLIEKLKSQNEKLKIVLTFFSPSGYEIRKNYPMADYIFYLPADSKKNAEKFISAVNPSLAIFIKYEFWFHYLKTLKKRNIPVFLISAHFRTEQHFFKWYGSWFRKMLKMFTHIFVQNESSKKLLEKFNIQNATVSGDTRFDRVSETVARAEEIPLIAKFSQGKKILIAGSTWPEDEKIISALPWVNGGQVSDRIFLRKGIKLIIAPHEIHPGHVNSIVQLFSRTKVLKFSEANEQNVESADILIIDNIGLLSRLYRYGDIAYIGGAFGKSLHNILEPAAFGLPVLFGPNHFKFWEAAALIDKGGAFSVNDSEELESKINFLLQDEMIVRIASEMSRNFVRSNIGAAGRILEPVKAILGV